MRLVPGDELRLRYSGDTAHPAWQSVGHVVCVFCLLCDAPCVLNLIFIANSEVLIVKSLLVVSDQVNCSGRGCT